ncbi:MAG: AbrB/MazE/SpoVT family DNA-binding domain-containing protein [Methanobrevibacter sp.]|nr:AbrB/MazE/SpoVT family DNA-binding domain-containing protein [Methanobrevibacter sp.]
MAKLAKVMYGTAKGERKLNCYMKSIPKEVVKQAGINEDDDLQVYAKDNKIIIERKK